MILAELLRTLHRCERAAKEHLFDFNYCVLWNIYSITTVGCRFLSISMDNAVIMVALLL